VADEVADAQALGHLDGVVRRTVVDDEDLKAVYALDLSGDGAQDEGKGLLLVQAGDLDEDSHELFS
jgi:hypothetical protein